MPRRQPQHRRSVGWGSWRPWRQALVVTLAWCFLGPSGQAQVAPGGLGTRVNGTALGRCSQGVCSVQGGTPLGGTLFHRFSQFDTRSGIQRVDLDTAGNRNVVVGVSHPAGSFFNAPLRLSQAASLFWLSPGGIWLGGGGTILGATNLLLSTAPTLRFGAGEFKAVAGLRDGLGPLIDPANISLQALSQGGLQGAELGAGDGPIVLAGGRLQVDRQLLLDSGAGPIRSLPGSPSDLRAGGDLRLSGGELLLRGLEAQAGTAAADGGVYLQSGAVPGVSQGRLELADAQLRGPRISLEGATTRLDNVRLEGGDLLLRSAGPLTATNLRARAEGAAGGRRLELTAGMPPAGGASLRLERSELEGQAVVIGAQGPIELRQVQARAAGAGKAGGVWLSSKAGSGGTASPIALERVGLQGENLVVQAAGDLRALELNAHAERHWWRAEGRDDQPASMRLEAATLAGLSRSDQPPGDSKNRLAAGLVSAEASGALFGRGLRATADSIQLRAAGQLALTDGSQLNAGSEANGAILLEALSPAAANKRGSLELRDSRLEAQTIIGRADQSLNLRQLSAAAGTPGNRGLLRLDTAPTRALADEADPEAGGSGEAGLIGSRLEGGTVIVRSGAIQINGSEIVAPKGKITLEAKAADLNVTASRLEVSVATRADLRSEVDKLKLGNNDDSQQNTPSIGLFAARDLRIGEGSELQASQNLAPLYAEHPDLRREEIRLTNTSGVVVADAGQSLSLRDSGIAADASDNLAGNILLRARGSGGNNGLSLSKAWLSASGGAGSGDIRLNSAHGIRIEASTLTANSHHSPKDPDPDQQGQSNWSAIVRGVGSFQGGEITLTNSAQDRPVVVLNSQLQAQQSGSDGPLSTFKLTGRDSDGGFTDIFDDSDRPGVNQLGGLINIFSAGGIRIAGPGSWLSTSSTPSGGGVPDLFGGVIRLVNAAATQPVEIAEGARIESITGPSKDPTSAQYSSGGMVNLWSQGPVAIIGSSMTTASLMPADDPSDAGYFQGGIALFSGSQVSIRQSSIQFGPSAGYGQGLGELAMSSPMPIDLSESVFSPGCPGACSVPWNQQQFEGLLGHEATPNIWGPFRVANNNLRPEMSESGIFVKDEVFTGNGLGKVSIPELIRVSSTNVPERKLFLAGNPPINLSENSGPGSSRSAAGSAAAPLAQNVAPIQPPSLAWQASVDLSMAKGQPVINTAWLANNETVAIVPALTSDGPTALSESAAIQSFLRQEQAATQAIIAALRLPQQAPARWAIAELQRFLQAAVPATTGPGVARAPSQTYIPAILQISLSKLPDAQTQINHILIPARGELRGWQRRVPTALLQASVRSVQRQLSQQENGEITAAGRQLGELLLQPVWPELQRQGINALLLSLDRGLQGLPFAALPAGNGLLVDQLAVTITPALALTDLRPEAAAGPPRRTLLAGARHFQQGLMPLAMAEQELRQLASLHPDSVVLFDQAFQTRALLAKTRERPVQILHLATHADFASDRAAGARIYTSDGELALSELGRQLRNGQPQPIGLFVLNACRTAVGDEQRELGISGLALQAGASSALGNLWFVDDAVTAAFSVQFHRLLQQGLRKDQALQRTQALFRSGQIKLRGSEIINDQGDVLISGLPASERARLASLAHPYYWAGAVLSGRPW